MKVQLKDVANIVMGQAPPGTSYNERGEGVPFLQGSKEFGIETPISTKRCSEPKKFAEIGDILFSVRAPVGDINVADKRYCIGRGLAAIQCDENKILRRYWFHLLQVLVSRIQQRGQGSTYQAIKKGDLEAQVFDIPPLEEQQRIAEILDRAENIKHLRQQAIVTTQRIASELFYEMFGDPVKNEKGWETATLGELATDIRNGFNPKKEQFRNGTPFITVNNLYGGVKIDIDSCVNVEATAEVIEKYKLEQGDLCFVRSSVKRLGVGQCSCFFSDKTAIFGGFVIRVQISPQILEPLFAAKMLLYPSIRHFIVEQSGTGTITNISQPSLKRTPLIVPPLTLQNEFLARLVSVNKISEIQSASNKQNEQLCSTLSAQFLAA